MSKKPKPRTPVKRHTATPRAKSEDGGDDNNPTAKELVLLVLQSHHFDLSKIDPSFGIGSIETADDYEATAAALGRSNYEINHNILSKLREALGSWRRLHALAELVLQEDPPVPKKLDGNQRLKFRWLIENKQPVSPELRNDVEFAWEMALEGDVVAAEDAKIQLDYVSETAMKAALIAFGMPGSVAGGKYTQRLVNDLRLLKGEWGAEGVRIRQERNRRKQKDSRIFALPKDEKT